MTEKRFKYKVTDGFFDEDRLISIKEVVDLLNEQEATIRKLQDLCGESDGENAKLRIENKRLQEEIKLLKPTNIEQYEQIQKLRKELGDCEKFRYTVFQRMRDVLDE